MTIKVQRVGRKLQVKNKRTTNNQQLCWGNRLTGQCRMMVVVLFVRCDNYYGNNDDDSDYVVCNW